MGNDLRMSLVTRFESQSPLADGEEALKKGYDYHQVFEALVHSKEVAENVFSRCAKKQIREALGKGEVTMLIGNEEDLPRRIWMSTLSVTMNLQGDLKSYVEESSESLLELSDIFSDQILQSRQPGKMLFLIDALVTEILEISPARFSFRLKQKWGIE
jgi:hypothetical protein